MANIVVHVGQVSGGDQKAHEDQSEIYPTKKTFSFFPNNNPFFEFPRVLFEHIEAIKKEKIETSELN